MASWKQTALLAVFTCIVCLAVSVSADDLPETGYEATGRYNYLPCKLLPFPPPDLA